MKIRDMRTATIYKIHNNATGKSYIGSTRRDILRRWREHISALNKNKYSGEFQKDWNEYDLTNWTFSVLETNVTKTKQYSCEQHWIDFYAKENQYNIGRFTSRASKYIEVLEMLDKGKTYYQIKEALGVSLGTISNIKNHYTISKTIDDQL